MNYPTKIAPFAICLALAATAAQAQAAPKAESVAGDYLKMSSLDTVEADWARRRSRRHASRGHREYRVYHRTATVSRPHRRLRSLAVPVLMLGGSGGSSEICWIQNGVVLCP